MTNHNYDAILFVSFGGPEGHDDVMPFLENVLRGKNVPRERMLEVAEHYYHFDGVSPINRQNRKLITAVEASLRDAGCQLPIYWGNRNWHPLLTDTMQRMADDGIKKALAFVTSAFSSYSGCRQYREDLAAARAVVGEGAPQIDKIRAYYNHPGFIAATCERLAEALDAIPDEARSTAPILFTAHSIPLTMSATCRYVAQLEEACSLVATELGHENWKLVYQSRSGPPTQPWLEPDICDAIRELPAHNVQHLVVVPIGFVSDHMEVLFDLDTEAQQLCDELGIQMARAKTVGTHPQFVSGVCRLILERIHDTGAREAVGQAGASHDFCPVDCCLSGRPATPPKPTVAGQDAF